MNIEEKSVLIKEKERLEKHLEAGKNILVFEELSWVREMIRKIETKIDNII
jgi:hypothetical protein